MITHLSAILYILAAILALTLRLAATRLLKRGSFKAHLALGISIFLIYTLLLQLYLFFLYENILTPDMNISQCYQTIAVSLLGFHIVTLLAGIIYYLIQKKRKIYDLEKMKLKDM